jgi:hypothetical protein
MTQKIEMETAPGSFCAFADLRSAIRSWPTAGTVWIDGAPHTYDVDDSSAHVYDGAGDEVYTVVL